jgi:5-methylcytosine-specific restriction endonuclease McrA
MLPFKHSRLRLDSEAYRLLRQAVLERDNWRCQLCGSTVGLEVHHIQHRSSLGDDAEGNLITLCSGCHQEVHLNRQHRRS